MLPHFVWAISLPFYVIPCFERLSSPFRSKNPRLHAETATTTPTRAGKTFKNLSHKIALIEYVLFPIRTIAIGPLLVALIAWVVWRQITMPAARFDFSLLALGALMLLHAANLNAKIRSDLRMAEFLRKNPLIHPRVFLRCLRHSLAFGRLPALTAEELAPISPTDTDFRESGRSEQKSWPLWRALFDTAYFARLILHTLHLLGEEYFVEVSDVIAALWGRHLLFLCRGHLSVAGQDKLIGKRGKFLLIFNHKSSMDFAFSAAALATIPVNDRTLRCRFIVAKDHFKDNPFVYKILGIGEVIERMGMIFISRKNREQGFADLKRAARHLIEADVDVAIYPQGTRAVGMFDRVGKRRDAGYYTTVAKREPCAPLSHLRKGTAYLALDVLEELYARESGEALHLVFIGINGTATVLPRGNWHVQTEAEVTYTIGDVVTLEPKLVHELFAAGRDSTGDEGQKEFVGKLTRLIDEQLKTATGLHDSLGKRYLTDLRGHFRCDNDKIEMVSAALRESERHGDTVFEIIDRTYSLPESEWNGYLSRLTQMLLDRSPLERLAGLHKEVTEMLAGFLFDRK